MQRILALHTRLVASGFGRLAIPAAESLDGQPTGSIQYKPSPEERSNIELLLERLSATLLFQYNRDALELRYENGNITLATITFVA